MNTALFDLFGLLRNNTANTITAVEAGRRGEHSYAAFADDIEACAGRLHALTHGDGPRQVGIIGGISYAWACIDLACLRLGIKTVAFPESLPLSELQALVERHPVDLLLIAADHQLANLIQHPNIRGFGGSGPRDLARVDPVVPPAVSADRFLDEYSLAFSSGTAAMPKPVPLRWFDTGGVPRHPVRRLLAAAVRYWTHRHTVWLSRYKKLIIFLPFSHAQQRIFFLSALFNAVDVVLSNPRNAVRDIIVERPNIMIGVPVIFELIASRIQTRLSRLSPARRRMATAFRVCGIHRWRSRNPIKVALQDRIFGGITKLYGGRGDYFVTGSASIPRETLEIFDSIGVRIYQGYGLTELGTIAVNTTASFRIGSVGKPRMEAMIGTDGEILVRFDPARHNPGALTVDVDGFVHTGDLGRLDKDGYLYVEGRKDDVLVSRNGKKIFPETAEALIREAVDANDACLFLDASGELAAVVVRPDGPSTAGQPQVLLAAINAVLPSYARVRSLIHAREPFSVENGMLTGTLKKRRHVIRAAYADAAFADTMMEGRSAFKSENTAA